MSENLATILTETAAEHGDRTAFKLDDIELTYSALDGSSARIAALLKARGLEDGDRVGLMLPNVPYFRMIRDWEERRASRREGRADSGAGRQVAAERRSTRTVRASVPDRRGRSDGPYRGRLR